MRIYTKEYYTLMMSLGVTDMYEPVIDRDYSDEEIEELHQKALDRYVEEERADHDEPPVLDIDDIEDPEAIEFFRAEIIEYENDMFQSTKPDLEEAIEKYNKSIKRFLYYPWGVWVTSYARANLFSGILACGNDYVYSDTDSVKVLHPERHMDYINQYNEGVMEKLKRAAEFHKIDVSEFSPLNRKGEPKPIGVWDFEGIYDKFKTVGAKRYMYLQNGEYHLTVAGVNKKKAMQYILKTYSDPFDGLDEGLVVPGDYSGRLLLDYCNDEPCSGVVKDYLGVEGEFSELSYVHMEPTTYELTYSMDYKAYTDALLEVRDDSW